VAELQGLDRTRDHFHLDYFADPRLAGSTDVLLSATPYHAADEVLESGKVLLRPDDGERRPAFVGEGI
jgi:hypothetical protein